LYVSVNTVVVGVDDTATGDSSVHDDPSVDVRT